MEITVKKEDIVSALNTTLGVVEKRQTLQGTNDQLAKVQQRFFDEGTEIARIEESIQYQSERARTLAEDQRGRASTVHCWESRGCRLVPSRHMLIVRYLHCGQRNRETDRRMFSRTSGIRGASLDQVGRMSWHSRPTEPSLKAV